jgi:hypothetical protein
MIKNIIKGSKAIPNAQKQYQMFKINTKGSKGIPKLENQKFKSTKN